MTIMGRSFTNTCILYSTGQRLLPCGSPWVWNGIVQTMDSFSVQRTCVKKCYFNRTQGKKGIKFISKGFFVLATEFFPWPKATLCWIPCNNYKHFFIGDMSSWPLLHHHILVPKKPQIMPNCVTFLLKLDQVC